MGALHREVERRGDCRIVLENAERLVRPADPSARNVPAEASRVAQRLCLGKVGLAPAESIFRLFAVFDVGVAAVPLHDGSVFIAKRRDASEEPAIDAIETPDARYMLVGCTRPETRGTDFHHRRQIFGMVGLLPTQSLGFGEREAGIVEPTLVQEIGPAI